MLPTAGSTSPATNKNRKQQEDGQAFLRNFLLLKELLTLKTEGYPRDTAGTTDFRAGIQRFA